jgi:hypothetical protein
MGNLSRICILGSRLIHNSSCWVLGVAAFGLAGSSICTKCPPNVPPLALGDYMSTCSSVGVAAHSNDSGVDLYALYGCLGALGALVLGVLLGYKCRGQSPKAVAAIDSEIAKPEAADNLVVCNEAAASISKPAPTAAMSTLKASDWGFPIAGISYVPMSQTPAGLSSHRIASSSSEPTFGDPFETHADSLGTPWHAFDLLPALACSAGSEQASPSRAEGGAALLVA